VRFWVRRKATARLNYSAAIALAELAGPKAPLSPNIPIAAASFEQADLLFGTARIMLTQGPLARLFEVYDTEILIKDRPGRMYRVAAAAGTNDGGRPTCFIADELHEWTGNKERVDLVLSNSLAKRAEALELNINGRLRREHAAWTDADLRRAYRLWRGARPIVSR